MLLVFLTVLPYQIFNFLGSFRFQCCLALGRGKAILGVLDFEAVRVVCVVALNFLVHHVRLALTKDSLRHLTSSVNQCDLFIFNFQPS